ncbi:MAG: DNA-binding response regulator [Rhodospirillales bacterium 20-60-12]|nr:MAG: DNA-binding response regulator [Rhodospirillales bacterium 20-60-12]
MSDAAESKRRDIILVVDDTPDTLGLLTDALEHANLTALVATSGQAALQLLDHATPDLILLDAIMPGLDGFETCRRIKQNPSRLHLPIIFMTGLSETEHVIRGLEAGGVDYVTKPIIIDELLARIRVHLTNARIAHRAAAALDATGRYLLAINAAGHLIWCTPQAETLLRASLNQFSPTSFTLPHTTSERQGNVITLKANQRSLEFTYLSRTGPDEFLYRLTETTAGQDEAFLRHYLSLTTREAEVVIWIARGKSNRDISEILGISPRTVNKHLEQIFTKLGVENRASAAALATRALATRS